MYAVNPYFMNSTKSVIDEEEEFLEGDGDAERETAAIVPLARIRKLDIVSVSEDRVRKL